MNQAKANDVLVATLDNLLDYAQFHFSLEEKLLLKHSYTHTEDHVRQHGCYLKEIKIYRAMIKDGVTHVDNRPITVDLWKFLKDWLVNHIKTEDMTYRDYFIRKGVISKNDDFFLPFSGDNESASG